jgi:hypothetical protein
MAMGRTLPITRALSAASVALLMPFSLPAQVSILADFCDTNQGFSQNELFTINNCEMHFSCKEHGFYFVLNENPVFKNSETGVTVRYTGGTTDNSMGLVFDYADEENYYLFGISPDGSFRLSRYGEYEKHGTTLYWYDYVPWTPSTYINQNGRNDLKVRLNKDDVICSINGHIVAHKSVSSVIGPKYYAGMGASGTIDCSFKAFFSKAVPETIPRGFAANNRFTFQSDGIHCNPPVSSAPYILMNAVPMEKGCQIVRADILCRDNAASKGSGVIARYVNDTDFYFFRITNNGTCSLLHKTAAKWLILATNTKPKRFFAEENNALSVFCDGREIECFLNGDDNLCDTVASEVKGGERWGLACYGGGECTFSNFGTNTITPTYMPYDDGYDY